MFNTLCSHNPYTIFTIYWLRWFNNISSFFCWLLLVVDALGLVWWINYSKCYNHTSFTEEKGWFLFEFLVNESQDRFQISNIFNMYYDICMRSRIYTREQNHHIHWHYTICILVLVMKIFHFCFSQLVFHYENKMVKRLTKQLC